jgi:hypothetical protein
MADKKKKRDQNSPHTWSSVTLVVIGALLLMVLWLTLVMLGPSSTMFFADVATFTPSLTATPEGDF